MKGEAEEILGLMSWPPVLGDAREESPMERATRATRAMESLQAVGTALHSLKTGDKSPLGNGDEVSQASHLALLVHEAASHAITWLSASPRTEQSHQTGLLYFLAKESSKAFMEAVESGEPMALSIYHLEKKEVKAAKASLRSFNRRGGRKIDMKTANNRAVAKLFRIIESYRTSWNLLYGSDAAESEARMKNRLHPLVKSIVNLEGLSPESWEAWHKVGLEVKRTLCLEIESSHLKRTWQLWGSLAPAIPLTTLIELG